MITYAFADLALAHRLERAEAAANASFVDARSRLVPASGATWIDVDGTWAMFDGVGSPLTQAFGFGLFSAALEEQLDALEHFFHVHKSVAMFEVSPLADPTALALLADRGYRPIELTTVMYQPIAPALTVDAGDIAVHAITSDESERWADASAAGWSEFPELADFMLQFGRVMYSSRNTFCFLATCDGHRAATGAMSLHDGVALLAGASTIPSYRGRGAQNALLRARLSFAASRGCDLAMMGASPGSASQRNAERQGFRVAYTRIKWGPAPHA